MYHAHLFNDALVLSKRITGFTGKFKFVRAIDLCVVTIKQVPSVQLTNSFCLESVYSSESASTSASYIFHCRSRSGLEWWMKNITEQLIKLSQRNEELLQQKEQRRNSMIKVARRASANWRPQSVRTDKTIEASELTSILSPPPQSPRARTSEQLDHVRLSVKDATTRLESLHNPNIAQPRVQYILKYLSNEFQFQQKLVDFHQVAIEPLLNTSKGADLLVGLTDAEREVNTSRKGSDTVLFERRGSYLGVLDSFTGKKQTQQISELILDSNFQIFLYTIENITYTLIEFLLLFEMSLMSVNYVDQLIILGDACLSSQADTLYQLLLSYASSYHTAVRIFSSSTLSRFKAQIEEKIPQINSINSFLIVILHFPERLKVFLTKLHDMTPTTHPDHSSLDTAIQNLTSTIKQMHDVYTVHINYEKLITIQNSFFFSLFQPEPYLKQLVSNQRIFVREGDLIKVCRKTNQEYRFWLFNDALLYGKFYNPTGKYKLHRVIELTSICNVQPYSMRTGTERQYSFIINSLEKSFILIAGTQDERNSWLHDITFWWNKLMKRINSNRLSTDSKNSVEDNEPAPLWVPDSRTSVCSICNIVSFCIISILIPC